MAVIEARVKQKIDTEANWLANPLVILQGEQAFVSNTRNFKIGDGTKTFSELPYFFNLPTDVYSKTEIDNKYKVISTTSTLENSTFKSPYYLNFGSEANKTVSQISVVRGGDSPGLGANQYSSGIYVKSGDSFMYINSSAFEKKVTVVSGTNTYTSGDRSDGWARNLAFTQNDVAISAPGFNNTSLRELKENIEDYEVNALELINNLKIVRYDYKDENAPKNMIGIIVDDETTADDFKDESGNAINIYKMISILTKSVQELSKKING